MLADKYKEYAIKTRRELHRIPEAGMHEYKTVKFIKEHLTELGIEYKTYAGTGIVGIIEGSKKGKTVALRADIDGLCIDEKTNLEYASEHEGMMHACGHDAHTAMLLTAAKLLLSKKDEINGKVKLIFQPSEEGPTIGAVEMVENGVVDDANAVFGVHVIPELETGVITCDDGPRMASADFFELTISGKSGHAAMPHDCVDATVIGASIVMNLQTLISRELSSLEPVVLTIGTFKSGTRNNVISGKAILTGTVRTFNQKVRMEIPEKIERIAKNIARAYRGEAFLEYKMWTKPVINDSEISRIVRNSATNIVGEDQVVSTPMRMGGDDFSEYLQIIPGAMALLGVKNEEKGTVFPLHHEKFNIDEDVLTIGVELYMMFAIEYLRHKNNI